MLCGHKPSLDSRGWDTHSDSRYPASLSLSLLIQDKQDSVHIPWDCGETPVEKHPAQRMVMTLTPETTSRISDNCAFAPNPSPAILLPDQGPQKCAAQADPCT